MGIDNNQSAFELVKKECNLDDLSFKDYKAIVISILTNTSQISDDDDTHEIIKGKIRTSAEQLISEDWSKDQGEN